MNLELERVSKIAEDSWYSKGANGWTTAYSFNLMKRFIRGANVLEMGPAEGVMTHELAQLGLSLTICEGSKKFCEALKIKYPKANVIHSLFEEFETTEKFDNIILGHVLEHVENPHKLLSRASEWLSPNGKIICAVPNSRSIHRQVAVELGLLGFEEELNEADRHHGHRRVYNPETFRREFHEAGLTVEFFGGYWLKPFSNSQFEQFSTPEMVEAFMKVGERYPDIAAELLIVAGISKRLC
ncbi:class I SAM-dependent methyltransferase [bacterium]|nr:class I SAM-dependent methyltransferase [bacterium]